jgi:hypothetical protein
MKSLVIGLFIVVAIHSIAPNRARQAVADTVPDLPSEITFERIYDGCEDCPDRKVVLRREGSKKFEEAMVSETDLHTKKQRQGRLRAYYYNNLLRLIESQGFFDMKNEYAAGVMDDGIVTLSVSLGEKRKLVKTRSEGDVPIALWGIYYALDGTLANVKWEGGQ